MKQTSCVAIPVARPSAVPQQIGNRHWRTEKLGKLAALVFVEMERGNVKLAKFYAENGFVPFDSRDDIEKGKPITYDQLFLFLK